MILWTIRHFPKNRKRYTELSEKPEYSHIKFVRLRSRKEVEDFVTHKLHKLHIFFGASETLADKGFQIR